VHVQVDAATGLGQLFDSDGNCFWAVDKMVLHVCVGSDSRRLLYSGQTPVGDLDALRNRHQIAEAGLVRIPGQEKLSVQAFCLKEAGRKLAWYFCISSNKWCGHMADVGITVLDVFRLIVVVPGR
jgi:hypothetical protein